MHVIRKGFQFVLLKIENFKSFQLTEVRAKIINKILT